MTRSRFCRWCPLNLKCWFPLLSMLCVINCVIFLSTRHEKTHRIVADNAETFLKILTIRGTPDTTTTTTTTTRITTAAQGTTKTPETADICRPVPETFPFNRQLLPCSWRSDSAPCRHRTRAVLRCSNLSASIVEERVKVGTPPVAVTFSDPCLMHVVRERCSQTGRPVPRVVHYVQFSPSGKQGREQPVYTFLGLLSALRFLQPCLLLFHADHLPYGKHWEALLQLTSRLVHVNRTAPATIFGHVIQRIEHKSDVARLEAMRAFGGIYLDTDEVLLQPMDDLLQHHVTMAWETPNRSFGNGLFLAEPNNTFLNAWYDKYRKFTNTWWAYFSTTVPRELYSQHPENIHVVDTFFRPNLWNITRLVYKGRYDWSNHYAMHLYYRRNQKYFRGNFEQRNTTLGEIARHILFGDKKRCV